MRKLFLGLSLLLVSTLVLAQVPQKAKDLRAVRGAKQDRFSDPVLRKTADSLAQNAILIDGHVDLPYRLKVKNFRYTKEFLGLPLESEDGDFDYKRARTGGLDAPFMSIYIPADQQGAQRYGGVKLADSLINMITAIADEHDEFSIATHPDSVRSQFARGVMSLPMGMENGAPLAYPEDVAHFAERGIRYVTLTHSKDNHICDSSYDTTRTWGGLSPYGSLILKELIDNKIMIDISHVSDSTFYQVLRRVDVPMIASHSSLRHFTPGFERNMNDDMVKALGENGGVVMINFGSTFLDSAVVAKREELRGIITKIKEARKYEWGTPQADAVIDSVSAATPGTFADIEIVADHIERAAELAGIDHVGIGSDYDGVGDSLPTGLKDVSDYPNLWYVLLERGFTAEDIAKVMGENLLRVWSEIEKH